MKENNALDQRMFDLRRDLQQAAQQFAAAATDTGVAPRQALLQLQKHMDHLRQAIWEARKLCDPHLMPAPTVPEPGITRTLAERIVLVMDAGKKKTA